MDWIRVNTKAPCPRCQKDSWCLVNPKVGLIICMRETSSRPKKMKDGSLGWIHQLDSQQLRQLPPMKKEADRPTINCRALIDKWSETTHHEWVRSLSISLRVSVTSLRSLGVCWAGEYNAWAFPMTDAYNNMVGIRLRRSNGTKFAVKGSHQGCFIPRSLPKPLALVAEGPTDTCAGLDLGFYTVGRPSCSGGIDILKHYFCRVGVQRAAIIADNDDPGVNGAKMLSDHLGIPTAIVTLPCKDLREFLGLGGDSGLINQYVNDSIWKRERPN